MWWMLGVLLLCPGMEWYALYSSERALGNVGLGHASLEPLVMTWDQTGGQKGWGRALGDSALFVFLCTWYLIETSCWAALSVIIVEQMHSHMDAYRVMVYTSAHTHFRAACYLHQKVQNWIWLDLNCGVVVLVIFLAKYGRVSVGSKLLWEVLGGPRFDL